MLCVLYLFFVPWVIQSINLLKMERRDFLTTTTLGTLGLGLGSLSNACAAENEPVNSIPKIVASGGGSNAAIVKFMASLTGKDRPRICYLPTAAADNVYAILRWFKTCAEIDVVPMVQEMFISSYSMKQTFKEVLLSMDAIVVSGGNTLNMMAIWKAQGIDEVLYKAWQKGIVLGGGSAGSLCWFEEGTTDSRPKELTKVECLGFLEGSHSPHYDGEAERRPAYHKLIGDGTLKAGYAVDNSAAVYFEGTELKKVVATRKSANAYYVEKINGNVKEKVLKPDIIL